MDELDILLSHRLMARERFWAAYHEYQRINAKLEKILRQMHGESDGLPHGPQQPLGIHVRHRKPRRKSGVR